MKTGYLLLLVLVGVVVCQDDFEYGDYGGGYDDYAGGYDDFGGGYDDFDYGGYGGGYDDYDGGQQEEAIPGVLIADEFSLPKLLNSNLPVVVEFVDEAWTPSSEVFQEVAVYFESRKHVLIVKTVLSSTDFVEKFSLIEGQQTQIVIFSGGVIVPVDAEQPEEAISFIETMIDGDVYNINNFVKGFTSKTAQEQEQALQNVDSFIASAENPSPLAIKLAKFVKKVAVGGITKLESEETRLENLLDNAANISAEKVMEFRVRLYLLKSMQD